MNLHAERPGIRLQRFFRGERMLARDSASGMAPITADDYIFFLN